MQNQQHAEEQGLLGSLCPGQKKLEGKTFYLDSVKKRATALLLEAISFLGGRVESYLHKDVSFVVTGTQEGVSEQKGTDTNSRAKETSEKARIPVITRESVSINGKPRPGTPRLMVCGSRGKALLEKAIHNNERLKGSSVLANARSWGVKILFVDDVLLHLKQLTRDSLSAIHKRPERTRTKQGAYVVKAAALRSPYLKIEDSSRKYKPLHMQSVTFPSLWYSGRFSPFESPPPPLFDKETGQRETKTREKKKVESSVQDKSLTPLSYNPSPWRPRKKDISYCECCHQPFNNLEEHLQSDQHRAFVLDLSNYSVLDQLVAEMLPGFDPNPPEQQKETLNQPPSLLHTEDVCELEPLTDAETEQAVQALQSFNAHTFIPSPGVQSLSPASIQPVDPQTDCRLPLSPAMPVLDAEPQTNHLANQQPDTHNLSPCISTDPYSLPPVLSPQVSLMMEPHSPYSEPPVLSPQQYTVDKAVEGLTCEIDSLENMSQFVRAVTTPVSSPFLSSVNLTDTDDIIRSNKDSLLGLSEIVCSRKDWECSLPSRRSCSLPRQLATAPNPKKRCRSASPEPNQSKRRRITERRYKSEETERDIRANHEGCLSFDKLSCLLSQQKLSPSCTGGTLPLNRRLHCFLFLLYRISLWH
ncbi:protein DBF4 homolog A [Notolabrus celidotus]|uniref:protein DBF4 homolog A n=1 Tax=Notolabrus celidotus TaxID=1203425 RepID=UPI00148F76F6|nr:protein DBF4 homolog A [Notolabrus celidotus]